MRILHLLASPFFTGPAESMTELALAQRELGHEVTIAVDRKRTTTTSEELAVPRLEPLGLLSRGALELSVKSNPFAMLRDVSTLRALEVDVVHSHFTHDHMIARLGRPAGAALIRSIHAPRSLRWATPAADGWTVPTDALARRLLGQRVVVLPPLVAEGFVAPNDRAALRRTLGLPERAPLVGMVSTFQPTRRHDVGLAAFAKVRESKPDAHLILVGDGNLQPALEAQARELGLATSVRFVGYQQGVRFVQHLQALDEVWILGLGNDWGGRAAAQARACGVRVVAVDEGALARYADAIVEPNAAAVASASLAGAHRDAAIEPRASVARRVLELYEAASR